jgi:glutaredoxin-like protein NrdH
MFCNRVKEFLSHKGISYKDRDVSRDEEALGELQRLGFMTTPVTVIGSAVVVGFDREKLEEALTK